MGRFQNITIHWLKVFKAISIRFVTEGLTYRASALTYTTLLALVPLLTVLFYILSFFPLFQNVGLQIQDYVFQNFVPLAGATVQAYMLTFVEQASTLSWFGIAGLAITALMLLFTIERSFNEIWQVKAAHKRLIPFLRYWIIMMLSPILIAFAFVISSYVFSIKILSNVSHSVGLLSILPFILMVIALTLLNIIVPNCRVKFRYGFLGGFISAVLFECARRLFGFYALHLSFYQFIYGPLVAIPLFLVWVYVCWLIILLGALISHAAATEKKTYR